MKTLIYIINGIKQTEIFLDDVLYYITLRKLMLNGKVTYIESINKNGCFHFINKDINKEQCPWMDAR